MDRFEVSLFDLTMGISGAIDMISSTVADHHKKVAYIAAAIGKELKLSQINMQELMLASLLHDSGAFSLKDRLSTLEFELNNPHRHSELGYLLLKNYPYYSRVADIIRFHHVKMEEEEDFASLGNVDKIPIESSIIHLADRVSILINHNDAILTQGERIKEKILPYKNSMFSADLTDAFCAASAREAFWLDIISPNLSPRLYKDAGQNSVMVNIDDMVEIGNLFRRLIDFRSSFTATHSAGVAATAECLARFMGFADIECKAMRAAGYLHDLGKLSIPKEILEKPDKLTPEEYRVIKTHSYHSFRTLEMIPQLDIINKWGSLHHERIDGKGYPFHLKGDELPLGSRIMAVADVSTAVMEDRPYRKGLPEEKVLKILTNMVDNQALDSVVVDVLKENYDTVNLARINAQSTSRDDYDSFAINDYRSSEVN